MRISDYIKDRIPSIIGTMICMVLLAAFLLAAGNTADTIALILICWLLIYGISAFISCRNRKKYMDHLLSLSKDLEEKYLIAEVMEKPSRADDRVYYALLKMSGKSMLEQIGSVQSRQKEYREYIERWVHEVKTPITAIKLICENHRSELTGTILAELEKLNHYVEQTLYYARSGHTEKDYLIRETDLETIIHQAISENKQLLMQNQVKIQLEGCQAEAYTDEKWIVFILNQLISNAVKYRGENPTLTFKTSESPDQIILCIKDNGIGIASQDLPRIFEKGFTGDNGRNGKGSTGMGLYLCRNLCGRLGVGIEVASSSGGTEFRLTFYKNHFIEVRNR